MVVSDYLRKKNPKNEQKSKPKWGPTYPRSNYFGVKSQSREPVGGVNCPNL
nr:MAG TPA: hypothetical protein [Caudoviricetes sp.]